MTRTADIDVLLTSWLAEGPERAPDDRMSAAVLEITHVGQRRAPIAWRLGDANGHGGRLLAMAAIASIAILVSIGVGIQTGLIRLPNLPGPTILPLPSASLPSAQPTSATPRPRATPRPSASIEQPESIDGYRTFIGPDGSFAIRMSDSWTAHSGDDPSALYLAAGAFDLSIRGEDWLGQIRTCDRATGRWETCARVAASDLDELAQSIGLAETPTVVQGPIEWAGSLGGEPANQRWIVVPLGGSDRPTAVYYAAAMHEGRPYVVRIVGPPPQGSVVGFGGMLDGFEFLAAESVPEPSAIEQPEAIDGVRTFVAPDGTFDIQLPDAWKVDRGDDPLTLYLRDRTQTLSISGADPNGELPACDSRIEKYWGPCGRITGTSLSELDAAIGLGTRGITYAYAIRGSLVVGGEPANKISIVGGPSATGAAYVVLLHDGRPFVIRYIQPGSSIEGDELLNILHTFRFLDP